VITGAAAIAPGETVVQTTKLDPAGAVVWSIQGEPGDPSWGADVEVDAAGNVYVTGNRSNGANADVVTVSYAPDGSRRWAATFDAGDDESTVSFAQALQVDAAGRVYVAASTHVLAYDATGQLRWVIERFNAAITLRGEELVITSPPAGTEVVDASGARRWHSPTGGLHVAIAPGGDVLLASIDLGGTSTADWDLRVVRLRADGSLLWSRRYDNGHEDSPADLAVDGSGAVYVTGTSRSRYGLFGVYRPDYLTLKYDAAGTLVWTAREKNLGAGARALALGADGRVTVTGMAGVTVQYRQIEKSCPWWQPWCWLS
jgi:hypothetical protein